MRNDAHDELDHVPSLRAEQRDHDDYAPITRSPRAEIAMAVARPATG